MSHLPVDDVLPDVAEALRQHGRVVVQAPPGAGKTTRIPDFLIERLPPGDIVVVEPRRLAARLAARHAADRRGEAVGATVGFQVRFDSAVGPTTRVRYVTEGVFLRQLLAAPALDGISAVLLDEFHERHLAGDLALAWMRQLQREGRTLHVGVMSATLDTEAVARFLHPAPIVRAQGRVFDVSITHENEPDDRPLSRRVASAVRSLAREGLDGDVLVFLPGAAEIRRALEDCGPVADAHGLALVALHGSLSHAEQDRALSNIGQNKVILSTNVAESSVTIDGVVAVVDSGLARLASHAPWSGLPVLRVAPISKASAVQRAGRAGRTRPGRCIRLYPESDFLRRPEHHPPEILRMDLTETALLLLGLGADPATFPWLEAPPPSAWEAALRLLMLLGATSEHGSITDTGRRLLRFPVHPRLGRILVEGERRGVAQDASLATALIGERDIRVQGRTSIGEIGRERPSPDLLDTMSLFEEAAHARFSDAPLRRMGVDAAAAREVDRARAQLLSLCRTGTRPQDRDAQLRQSVLTGYPDRVARHVHDQDIALVDGGSARVEIDPAQRVDDLLVAVDAEERREGRSRRLVVRTTCRIEPEWLLDLYPEHIDERAEHSWNAGRECVETVEQITYRGLAIDETRGTAVRTSEVAGILFEHARTQGIHRFAPEGFIETWLARIAFVRERRPDAELPNVDADAVERILRSLCEGLRCFSELASAGLAEALQGALDGAQRESLARLAPEHVTLPGGRRLQVRYEPGKHPWASSRLQDFFGLVDGPRIAGGEVPVVLHLLAPNHRAVQVTQDLAGFWTNHYPQLRKQLCRRYPKHAWPEDGRTAHPPAPGKLR